MMNKWNATAAASRACLTSSLKCSTINTTTSSFSPTASTFNTQLRFRQSNKTRLWGRPKGHKFLRGGGQEREKSPARYHNQDTDPSPRYDPMKFQFKQEKALDEAEEANCKHMFELFNNETVATPDYTHLIKGEDHPFYKLCVETSDQEWAELTVFDIMEKLGNKHISPFEIHFGLPLELKKKVWERVEREIHPELIKFNPTELIGTNIGTSQLELEVDRQMQLWAHPEVRKAMKELEVGVANDLTGSKRDQWEGYLEILETLKERQQQDVHERISLFKLDKDHVNAGLPNLTENAKVDKAEAYALRMWFQGLNEVSAHAEHAKRYIEAYKASTTFTEADGDRLFELHKENPDYWTGDRLGAAFGISRNQAWGEILVREADEAQRTGKPFCPEKVNYLFHRDQYKLKTLQERYSKKESRSELQYLREATSGQIVDEDAIYKKFLEKTSKPIPASGLDDDLPEWVRRPFQEPRSAVRPTVTAAEAEQEGTSTTESVLYPRIESAAGLGTNTVRQRHRIIEMKSKSRINAGEKRRFLMLETDGTLRTMDQDTQEWINAKPLPFTKLGLGGKMRRRKLFRMRDF